MYKHTKLDKHVVLHINFFLCTVSIIFDVIAFVQCHLLMLHVTKLCNTLANNCGKNFTYSIEIHSFKWNRTWRKKYSAWNSFISKSLVEMKYHALHANEKDGRKIQQEKYNIGCKFQTTQWYYCFKIREVSITSLPTCHHLLVKEKPIDFVPKEPLKTLISGLNNIIKNLARQETEYICPSFLSLSLSPISLCPTCALCYLSCFSCLSSSYSFLWLSKSSYSTSSYSSSS